VTSITIMFHNVHSVVDLLRCREEIATWHLPFWYW